MHFSFVPRKNEIKLNLKKLNHSKFLPCWNIKMSCTRRQQSKQERLSHQLSLYVQPSCVFGCCYQLMYTHSFKVPTTLQNLEASIGTHHRIRTWWHIFLPAAEDLKKKHIYRRKLLFNLFCWVAAETQIISHSFFSPYIFFLLLLYMTATRISKLKSFDWSRLVKNCASLNKIW
jgi:hypothetical protein